MKGSASFTKSCTLNSVSDREKSAVLVVQLYCSTHTVILFSTHKNKTLVPLKFITSYNPQSVNLPCNIN